MPAIRSARSRVASRIELALSAVVSTICSAWPSESPLCRKRAMSARKAAPAASLIR
jgi:hypothetical protein